MPEAPYFYARAQVRDAKRGYLSVTIPPDEIDKKKIRPRQMLRVTVDPME